jgi:VanZ family protein
MQPPRSGSHPHDRASDRLEVRDFGKPAVLRRSTLRTICIGVLLLVVYGTLGPLGHGDGAWIGGVDQWRWMPEQSRTDANDVLTNLLVYIPVGVALRLLVRRRGMSGWTDVGLAMFLAVLLSYVTELLQQIMPARSSNLIDIYVNSFAALVGCMIAVPVQRILRRVHEYAFFHVHFREGTYTVLGWTAVLVAFILMTWPWELKRPQMTHGLDQPLKLADPLRFARFAAFAIVGYFLTGTAIVHHKGRGRAARGAVLRVVLFVVALELAQAILGEHVSSFLHALVATVGAAAGAFVGYLVVKPRPGEPRIPQARGPGMVPEFHSAADHPPAHPPKMTPTRRVLLAALLGAATLGTLCVAVLPGATLDSVRAAPQVYWAPFHGHFGASFKVVILDVLQQCTLYAFLTFLCLYLTEGRRPSAALMMLLGLVTTIEVCQAFLSPRAGDTTGLVLATVTWITVTRIWKSLYPLSPDDAIEPAYLVEGQESAQPAAQ